jgi:hypothetical protein
MDLDPLNALVGEWTIEATHPAVPGVVVTGSSEFEWLSGGKFLIQRSSTEHADFPDSLSVIGEFDGALAAQYFDSRGVYRVYATTFADGVWRMSRDAPGFSQRFEGTLSADGSELAGTWELSRDDATWADDLAIAFRRG